MEAGYPGFLAFAPSILSVPIAPVNLGQLIAAIQNLASPGTAPELSVMMPPFAGVPSQRTGAIQRSWVWTYVAALSGAFVSGLMFDFPSPASAAGVLILGGSIALALRQPAEIRSIDKIISQATEAWKNIEAKWNEVKDSHQFLRCRSEADEVIRNSQNLGREEANQLADLKVKQREAQLQIFLQRFYIERAKIKGIGNTRKVMLRSYGIETAADVELHRVQAISGFGPVIAGNLVAWRRSVEKRFMFDPNQPINPTDIAAVKPNFSRRSYQRCLTGGEFLPVPRRCGRRRLTTTRRHIRRRTWRRLRSLRVGVLKVLLASRRQFGAVRGEALDDALIFPGHTTAKQLCVRSARGLQGRSRELLVYVRPRAVLGARRVSAGDLPVGLPSASRLHQGLDESALCPGHCTGTRLTLCSTCMGVMTCAQQHVCSNNRAVVCREESTVSIPCWRPHRRW